MNETKQGDIDIISIQDEKELPIDDNGDGRNANENSDDLEKNLKQSQSNQELGLDLQDDKNKIIHTDKECLQINEKTSSKLRKFLTIRIYFHSIFVRILFMTIPSFDIYFLSCVYESKAILTLYGSFLIIAIDGLYVIIKRKGRDYYWFSITMTVYVIISLGIIFATNEFKILNEDVYCMPNKTNVTLCDADFNLCIYSQFIIILFLASLVVARWFLPNSIRMSREAIYYQIAGFTSSAADIIDIADYFDNSLITKNKFLARSVRIIFMFNTVQFCFSLQAIKRRNTNLTGVFKFVDILFVTEAWSQLLIFLTQELPCLIIRLIFIFSVEVGFEFSLYFFVIKNALMCILLLYRVGTLTYKVYAEERKIKPV